jgi:antitoxin VapB
VTGAVKDRPEQIKRRRSKRHLAERLDEIAKHCAALPILDGRRPEEMLYDEHGLPDK